MAPAAAEVTERPLVRLACRVVAMARFVRHVSVHPESPPDHTTLLFCPGNMQLQRLTFSDLTGDVVSEGCTLAEGLPVRYRSEAASLEVLQAVHDKLEREALAAEERLLEAQARRARTEQARKNLAARLKGHS